MARWSLRKITIFIIFIMLILPVFAQEVTETPELMMSPTATSTPTPTPELTEMLTPSPEMTLPLVSPTAIIEQTAEATEPVIEVTQEAELTVVVENTPEATEAIPESTLEAELTELAENTPEATEAIPESTLEAEITEIAESTAEAEASEELTESTAEVESTAEITETVTPEAILLATLTGSVRYQSRDNVEGIAVQIWTRDFSLFRSTNPDEQGMFSIDAPAENAFYLVISAPLHQQIELYVGSVDVTLDLVLAGGDLNADHCINGDDLSLLMSNYNREESSTTDINQDGLTDLSDLAILSGNYDENCMRSIFANRPIAESMLEPEITPESTELAVSTPETTQAPIITPEAEATNDPSP